MMEFLVDTMIANVIEKIKSEFQDQLASTDTSKFDLGVFAANQNDEIVFLPHDATVASCNLENRRTVLSFVDASEFMVNDESGENSENGEPEDLQHESSEPEGIEGFLLKEGPKSNFGKRGWKRRWVTTQENRLNYYLNKNDKDPIGVITLLNDVTVRSAPQDGNIKIFEIITQKRIWRFQALS